MKPLLNYQELLDLFISLLVCVRDTSNTDALIMKYFRNPIFVKQVRHN
jgi:hypothetical protein